jgi:hypothetical protein
VTAAGGTCWKTITPGCGGRWGPTVWTTLTLTIYADDLSRHELVGASSFPRHWIYDATGALAGKSALIDFKS